MSTPSSVDVLVIGAGPAGLTAATRLRELGVETVLIVDRESEAGGIPRHSDHTGYGLRDLRRVMTGPEYARRLVDSAASAGAQIRTSTMVTDWAADRSAWLTSPQGRELVAARAVLLATGARERPRTARLIPGDRPGGVLTTGMLQNLVHVHHQPVGERAVIVGSELVSWSAVLTLREAGCRTVLMTSEHQRLESYAAVTLPGRLAMKVPVARRTQVARVIGKDRVRAVEIRHLDTGQLRTIECDTVVFTGDWIPDSELARRASLDMDPALRGPLVDTALRTSAPGVYAAGNIAHPVDTADVAALDGRHAADQVMRYLDGAEAPVAGVRILAEAPLRWIAPGVLRPGDPAPARGRYLAWPDEFVGAPMVVVRQSGGVVARRRLPWPAAPGRVFRIPSSLLAGIDARGGEVVVGLG